MKNRTLISGMGVVTILLLVYMFIYQGFWVWVVENTVVP